jgi:uncharacterized protein (DUF427 family)
MPKTTAIWNGQVIAASDHCIQVEGNAYFPPDGLDMKFFKSNSNTSACHWKGTASYFDVVVDGKTNAGAAWVYREPMTAAAPIKGYVAFWKGVEVKGADAAVPMAR